MRAICRHSPRFSVLNHVTADGKSPTMVDVSSKSVNLRVAAAMANVKFPFLLNNIMKSEDNGKSNEITTKKGPVFHTAIVAGTMAAKNTANLIPFCHNINLSYCGITIDIDNNDKSQLIIKSIVKTNSNTGVEMEALVAVNTAALCIYDMCKSLSHVSFLSSTNLFIHSFPY